MSILDEHIEPSFHDLLANSGWKFVEDDIPWYIKGRPGYDLKQKSFCRRVHYNGENHDIQYHLTLYAKGHNYMSIKRCARLRKSVLRIIMLSIYRGKEHGLSRTFYIRGCDDQLSKIIQECGEGRHQKYFEDNYRVTTYFE